MNTMKIDELRDYNNWIGKTAIEVYYSVIAVGGWQNVFPHHLPRWASRIRQYFNVTPILLRLLNDAESTDHLSRARKAIRASVYAKARRMLGSSYDPNNVIDGVGNSIGTAWALSGDVYEDVHGRSIWYQMSPGGAIYHFKEKIESPTLRAIGAAHAGQEYAPVFKLVCPDGTGGSREVCIENPFNVRSEIKTKIDGTFTRMVGHKTIGAVNEIVDVSKRIEKDSVAQGSYNYAETTEKGLPAHEKLDVHTDPMQPGYYVEPHNLFQMQFTDLSQRRFPTNDPQGQPLAAQNKPAP